MRQLGFGEKKGAGTVGNNCDGDRFDPQGLPAHGDTQLDVEHG